MTRFGGSGTGGRPSDLEPRYLPRWTATEGERRRPLSSYSARKCRQLLL